MKSLFLFLVLVAFPAYVYSQDIHLSQFYTSNQSLNPAYTANFDGDIRAVANSRSQWTQIAPAMKTNIISIEKKVLRHPDEFGIGAIVINEQISTSFLNTTKAYASGSFQKIINGHFIRVGIQAGVVSRTINLGGQTFPDQWNYGSGTFDPSTSNGESTLQNSRVYGDLNAGAAWAHTIGKVKVSAGYAIFHLNHPNDGFTGGKSGLPFRHSFNASAFYYFHTSFWLTPNLLYMRSTTATDFVVSATVHKRLNQSLSIMAGPGYRGSTQNSDAAILIVGGTYKRIMLGFSWDFNVSTLSQNARNKSAWELSLCYTTPARIAHKVTIPCDRY